MKKINLSVLSCRYVPSLLIINLFVLPFLMTSCDERRSIKGNGDILTDHRDLAPFKTVSIQGHYEIILKADESEAAIIEADENILHHIITEVKDGVLMVYDGEKIKSDNNLKITLQYKTINELHSNGASNVRGESVINCQNLLVMMSGSGLIDLEIEAENLDLDLSGAGLIKLKGKVNKESINMSGAGSLDAFNLISNECHINLNGIGNAQLYVNESLNASISGVGGITYKGNPSSINRSVAGIGRINHEND